MENTEIKKKGHNPSALSAFSAVNMVCIELFMPFNDFMLLIEGSSVIFWQNKYL